MTRNWLAAFAVLVALFVCGCSDNSAEKDRPGGFYGGASAGGMP